MKIATKHPFAAASVILFAALSMHAGQHRKGEPLKIEGAFSERASGTVSAATLKASGNGAGAASEIGPFTFTNEATVDLPTGLSSNEGWQLTTSNGEALRASCVGRALPITGGSRYAGLCTITGGTGQFQGATGRIDLTRYFDDTNVPAFTLAYGTIKGTIELPGRSR